MARVAVSAERNDRRRNASSRPSGFTQQAKTLAQACGLAELASEINQRSCFSQISAGFAQGSKHYLAITEALEKCNGVKTKAADFLGINRNTLNKKVTELGIEASE